ncbi:MAG: PilZ domain-containing protein [Elusimicrobia bacterium]|nr:PilZ domain-containing protein [Elusimicrobiota bacterium]
MGIERRKEKRMHVSLPVKLVFSKKEELSGVTVNISRLGSYIEVSRQFDSGAELDVTLEIPDYGQDKKSGGQVRCNGTVFRCDLREGPGAEPFYGIGVFFTSFASREERERLSKYVDFLIVKEEEDAREGFKKWKEKKLGGDSRRRLEYEKMLAEMNEMLKKALAKLEKIEKALQSR